MNRAQRFLEKIVRKRFNVTCEDGTNYCVDTTTPEFAKSMVAEVTKSPVTDVVVISVKDPRFRQKNYYDHLEFVKGTVSRLTTQLSEGVSSTWVSTTLNDFWDDENVEILKDPKKSKELLAIFMAWPIKAFREKVFGSDDELETWWEENGFADWLVPAYKVNPSFVTTLLSRLSMKEEQGALAEIKARQ